MDPGFGARLRLQREKQQIALSTIADQTKIKLSLLVGLERDDLSYWPKGIYGRSYVRSYARAIGLDPDAVVREFTELYPDPVEDTPAAMAAAMADAPDRGTGARLRSLIGSAFGALPRRRPPSNAPEAASQETSPALSLAAGTVADSADDNPDVAYHAIAAAAAAPAPVAPAPAPRVAAPAAAPLATASAAAAQPPVDLPAIARLCTKLARAVETGDLASALGDATRLLDAAGAILWASDERGSVLHPVLAHGYGQDVLAQLAPVARDSDNALAAAFRTSATRSVHGRAGAAGALVVPLLTPSGCAGVFALEFGNGGEQREWVRALATIFAAQFSTLVGAPLAAAASA